MNSFKEGDILELSVDQASPLPVKIWFYYIKLEKEIGPEKWQVSYISLPNEGAEVDHKIQFYGKNNGIVTSDILEENGYKLSKLTNERYEFLKYLAVNTDE